MSELLMKMPPYMEFKRKHLFLVKYSQPFELPEYITHKASRPSYNASKGKWDDISFLLRDPISPSTTKAIMKGLNAIKERKRYKKTLGRLEYKSMSNPEIIHVEIEMLDPSGIVVEKWTLSGKIKKVDFGVLDYTDDGLSNIELIFKVKTATLSI